MNTSSNPAMLLNSLSLRVARMVAVIALVCGASSAVLAQAPRFDVTGVVTDSTDAPLSGATVVVLQAADSTLVSFGITRPDGAFRIGRVPAGSHLLQVTFVGYTPHSQAIAVSDGPLDVGRIRLGEAVAELGELVVRADHIPMVVKRDTLEYNAAAFRVPPGSNVEDLLRRLPGIEVERDGTITAQGEQVRQVLVDGREFFGSDPTVATRNLPADAVDRVQVYDRRSDRAEFTGVDDGEEQRTINLNLRPDRRQGYFGNATAGLGDLRRYEGRASVNRFSTATQLSFISNVNNVNQQGFSINDYVSFMGGAQALMSEGGRFSLADVPINRGASDGFTTTVSAGVNLNHEFSSRTSLRTSYLGYYIDQELDRNVLQQQLAGSTNASSSEQQVDQLSSQLNHRLNVNLNHAFREGHDIRLRSNLQMSDGELRNWSNSDTWNADGGLENSSLRTFDSSSGSLRADAALTYRRRFAPGRTMTAEVRSSVNDGDQSGELAALSEFYRDGNVLTSEEIDQLQSQLSSTFTHRQRLTYTEPLGTRQLLQFDLAHRVVLEDQERSVFDLADGGPRLNDALSSAFDRTYRYYTAGVNFRRAVDPLTLRLGVDLQQAQLEGTIRDVEAGVDRRFVNLLPSAAIGYAFSRTRNLEFRYNASTREPSMRDLQPFADNSDPLNIYVGNPDLRPEYAHNATLRFASFDPFTFTNMMAFVRFGYTLDRIVRARTIDEHLRQTVTSINADGDWSVAGSVNFGTPIRPLGVRVNLSNQAVYNRGIEFINGEENATNILRNTLELRFDNRNKDVVDAVAGARYTFNDARYALNPSFNRSYVNRTFFGEVTYRMAESWRVTTALDYHLYSREAFGTASQVPLLRAELSRMVMNDRAEIRLEGRDLLNQNVGVNYSSTSMYIQEERIQSLGRYVMLKFIYNLGGARRAGGPGIQMIGG